MLLTPGKLYKIKQEQTENIMRSCDSSCYLFIKDSTKEPLFLLYDFKGYSRDYLDTKGLKQYPNDNYGAFTTIFLVKNKTIHFRSYTKFMLNTNTRSLFLNALLELK